MTRPADVTGTSDDDRIDRESSAFAAQQADPCAYYYVRLTPAVSLSSPRRDQRCSQVFTSVPNLPQRCFKDRRLRNSAV